MQTQKEVNKMHAASIRTGAMNTLVALLASVALAAAFAPILGGDALGPRSEPNIMPGGNCPPQC